jgi:hypothetical protein
MDKKIANGQSKAMLTILPAKPKIRLLENDETDNELGAFGQEVKRVFSAGRFSTIKSLPLLKKVDEKTGLVVILIAASGSSFFLLLDYSELDQACSGVGLVVEAHSVSPCCGHVVRTLLLLLLP